MTSRQNTISDAVEAKIISDSDSVPYVFTSSELVIGQTYYPRARLEDIDVKPYIWVVPKAPATTLEVVLRKPEAGVIWDLQVHVAIQQKLNPAASTFDDDCRKLSELLEQVQVTCMDNDLVVTPNPRYLFQRIEPLQDSNGNVYNYEDLTEKNVWNSIFTTFYQLINQPT